MSRISCCVSDMDSFVLIRPEIGLVSGVLGASGYIWWDAGQDQS